MPSPIRTVLVRTLFVKILVNSALDVNQYWYIFSTFNVINVTYALRRVSFTVLVRKIFGTILRTKGVLIVPIIH